jgi:GNAT superfamily N-acetyltransferase
MDWQFKTSDGLLLRATDSGFSDIFNRFYAGFDNAFVLANEKEDVTGFQACLNLNNGAEYARISAQYGIFREAVFIAENAGKEIGGANFIAMPVNNRTVTANLNYIYVDPAARGRGYLAKLYAGVRDMIVDLFAIRGEVLVFIEQNDPFRMSEEDYRHDTEFTGLDQFDRLRIWAKLGAKVVDFGYRQPPLSADRDVDDTLLLSVLGANDNVLDACVLEGHLRRFFGISVLKGEDLRSNPPALDQLDELRAACSLGKQVGLLDPMPLLSRIRSRETAFSLWPEPPVDFRAALKI